MIRHTMYQFRSVLGVFLASKFPRMGSLNGQLHYFHYNVIGVSVNRHRRIQGGGENLRN
jgi:hypothetical protein